MPERANFPTVFPAAELSEAFLILKNKELEKKAKTFAQNCWAVQGYMEGVLLEDTNYQALSQRHSTGFEDIDKQIKEFTQEARGNSSSERKHEMLRLGGGGKVIESILPYLLDLLEIFLNRSKNVPASN